jgi:WD40 repeat protein
MCRSHHAFLLLTLAVLGLGVFLCGSGLDDTAFAAAEPPGTVTPAAKDPASAEDDFPLPQEQKDKITLVPDNGGHTGPVVGLFFSPDRRELISASTDCTVRYWDIDTGEPLQVLRPRLGGLSAAALSHDGRTIAVAGTEDKVPVVQLINTETQEVKALKGYTNRLEALAFAPNGKWLAGIGPNQNLCLWDLTKGLLAREIKGPGSLASHLAFDPESKQLVTGGERAHTWPVAEGARGAPFRGHEIRVDSIAWSPDGKHIAAAGPDGVHLWDADAKKATQLNDIPTRFLAFSGDSRKLLYVYGKSRKEDHGATVRDLATGREQNFIQLVAFSKGALSPDGELAAVTSTFNNAIWIWRTSDGKQLHQLVGHAKPNFGIGWSADGKAVAYGNSPGGNDTRFEGRTPLAVAFSLESLAFVQKPSFDQFQRAQLKREGLSLEFEPGKGLLVKRGSEVIAAHRPSRGGVICASFAGPDRAVLGNAFGLVMLDTKSGEEVCRLAGHVGQVVGVAPSPDGRYLASAGQDMTVRTWDLERAKGLDKGNPLTPTLSLFFGSGRSWIAWTPEGYYADSPDGDRYVGWQVDNGPGKLSSYFPVEQFRKAFYRPDLIKSLLAQGSLEKALWLLDKARHPIEVTGVLPPRVTMTAPTKNGLHIDKPELTIEAVAESSGKDPILSLQLLMDGRPFSVAKGVLALPDARPVHSAPVKWVVQVPPGRHRFSIVANTEKSSGDSGELWVTYEAPQPQPRLFVLLFGINEYVRFNKLNCAAQDAEALKKAFLANANQLFSEVQTRLIEDQAATRKGILDGLDWLKDNVKEEDVAVVFYAGHGDSDDKGQFHLVTVDAHPKLLPLTAVSGPELKVRLAALKSRRVLVLLDACHAGAMGTDDLARDLKRSDCGVAVLCAAEGTEVSLESIRDGHGYFTKALLTGLEGEAGKNPAGEITLARLYAFVQEKVPEDTQDRQHPVLALGATRSFALTKP